jgi:anaphase-promoting complex subunit 6
MSGSNAGPSGRTPFPAAAPSRNQHVRRGAEPRSSIDNSFNGDGGLHEAHSPFLNNLLRFSPKNSGHHHLSPLNHRGRDSVTNAGQQQRRARFFETAKSNNNVNENENAVDMNEEDDTVSKDLLKECTLMDGIPIDHLRGLANQALLTSPATASFYSGLLFAKTGSRVDALMLAKAHYAAGQYEACLRILEEAALLEQESPWEAVLVAAQALTAKKDWGALTEMLEDVCRLPDHNSGATTSFHSLAASQPLEDEDQIGWLSLKRSVTSSSLLHPLALLCWYRGQAYHETGCGIRATTYWKLALRMDCQCQQAWESLLETNLVTAQEAYDLIVHELEFAENQDWLRSLYLARIELTPQEPMPAAAEAAHTPALSSAISMAMHGTSLDASSIQLSSPIPSFQIAGGLNASVSEGDRKTAPPPIQQDVDAAFDDLWNKHKLQDSPQVLAMAARRSYRRYDWKAALSYCQDLAQLDPAVKEAAFCYVATLVVLGHKRVLFRLAHEWVEASPKSAQAWFAVGAYYYCIQRYHIAQRHFCRATRLDPQCTEAWIAFGCSFAACDESDQALASFRAAQRLSPGEHSSLMYMGMEYVRTNHAVLAHYFLQAALAASGGDPLCLHELGVLAMQKNDHADAISWFRRTLASAVGGDSLQESIDLCNDAYWEPTVFNLGHSYRRSRRFEQAASCFSRCIALCPEKFSTYSALAFTKHLMGNLDEAISYYHQALSMKPDDPFSTEMLSNALEDHIASRPQIFDLPASSSMKTTQTRPSLCMSPMGTPTWRQKQDSLTSEDMEVDVDMSAAS